MARMLARLGRAFLIGALLLAQHAALAHELWHELGAPSAQGAKAPGSKANTLCQVHDLLGAVLGVAGGAAPTPVLLELADTPYVGVSPTPHEAPRFPPRSRDPPLVS